MAKCSGVELVLDPTEVYAITRKTQPAAQMRVLRNMGIRCYRTDDPSHPVTVVREWLTTPTTVPQRSKPMRRSQREQTTEA